MCDEMEGGGMEGRVAEVDGGAAVCVEGRDGGASRESSSSMASSLDIVTGDRLLGAPFDTDEPFAGGNSEAGLEVDRAFRLVPLDDACFFASFRRAACTGRVSAKASSTSSSLRTMASL